MTQRKQINLRIDDDVLEAIDDIRAMSRPIPSISDVIRQAILEKRDAMKRQEPAKAEPPRPDNVVKLSK